MPKLLQIDSCLGIGSTGKIAENIAILARQRGWRTYMVHGSRYIGESEQIPIPAITRKGEYLNILNSLLLDNHGLTGAKYTYQLIDKIKNINPDIIQLHCIHGYYLNYKVLFEFLKDYKKPVVWTQHDCWGFTGHCAYFEKIHCEKWKRGCGSCDLKNTYPRSVLFDNSKKNWIIKNELTSSIENLTIVSVSYWLDKLVSQSFLSKKDHIVIPNGIDTNVFLPRKSKNKEKYGLEDKFILLAAATSWSDSKGLLDYIEISKRLMENEKLVLIGITEGQRKYLPPNILALSRTNNAIELAEWYSCADIVMNLSYQETFGLTTVEGMACGSPGIVYNCTASPELISPKTGIIVNPGDIEGVLNAISIIKKACKSEFSRECRKRVMENFDMDNQFKKYIDLYEELLINTRKN